MLIRRPLKETPLHTAVSRPTAVGLVFWCIASFMAVDALAASLERIEFESASQPLHAGRPHTGPLAKPDGAGPFPAVIGLHGCAGMHETTKQSWPMTLLRRAMSSYSWTALQRAA